MKHINILKGQYIRDKLYVVREIFDTPATTSYITTIVAVTHMSVRFILWLLVKQDTYNMTWRVVLRYPLK